MFTIQNEELQITISAKGAELQSVYNNKIALGYLWGGDPAYWGKKSPVLFPIVGTLKNDSYYYQGKPYHLSRHGFARDMVFSVEEQGPTNIVFILKSNQTTLINFPFEFEFRISYHLQGNSLRVGYGVTNCSNQDMFFSVGGHPAFKLPLVDGTNYDDYFLEFNEHETSPRWPISKDGLIEKLPEPLLIDTNILPLSKGLFSKDALVFKNPSSSVVSIKSKKTEHGLDFDFSGFPFLGLWAARDADFVCIEPWCGIADSVNANQQLTEKEGINQLAAGKDWQRSWTVSFY